MHVAVIGSGPAGVSCAQALVARGVRVTIIDIGETLDAGRQSKIDALADIDPAEWPAAERSFLTHNPTLRDWIPRKVLFGSDFPYGLNRPYLPLDTDNDSFAPSVAKGGYSMVWGASALPIDGCDMSGWPISQGDLAPYYTRVLEGMALSGGKGTLEDSFPAYTKTMGQISLDSQSRALLADMERGLRRNNRDVLYGVARLALRAADCKPCGMCLVGCPRGAIHATPALLAPMIESGSVAYRSDLRVDMVEEGPDGARVALTKIDNGTRSTETFDKIFIGAGTLGTARILLQSKRWLGRALTVRESAKVLVPVLRFSGAPTALGEPKVALPNVFIEAKIDGLGDHWVHAQISSVNDMVLERLGMRPDQPRYWKRTLARPLLTRLMVAWCGLHSDYSATLSVTLEPASSGQLPVLTTRGHETAKTRVAARRAARGFLRLGLRFGTLFIAPLMRLSKPGTGYHCGGTFPMRAAATAPTDTDILGRPFGWSRIHVIDGSVLPTIPGTTIALPIMANAMRIGATVPLEAGY